MSKIRILSDHLANQIAAGEVVERPASVVKELLENSLDAGADRIDVQVEGGGTRLIRIADNGMGMDQDDVMLCLERHATSKLIEENQLAAIATLGFRGEALPSIGSVSRMTVLSRPHTTDNAADIGTRAEIRYGTLHAVHDDGCARGTVIEVRGLFGNLPARKKFLKTKRTELFHIEEVILNQSLAHPEVAFSLLVEGRKIIALAAADEEQRLREVFRYQDTLLPVHAVGNEKNGSDVNGLAVNGYLLLPDAAASARLRILVNKRPVQDRMIRHAVIEGLQGFLMKGRQPAGALLLELSPELVDINVHPAKREIRFRNPREMHRFIVGAVVGAIRRHQEQVRSELFAVPGASEPAPVPASVPAPALTERNNSGEDQDKRGPRQHRLASCSSAPSIPDRTAEPGPVQYQPVQQHRQSHIAEPLQNKLEDSSQIRPVAAQPEEHPGQIGQLRSLRYGGLTLIGQFLNLYLLCEHDGQLVVIDQHAAHERILYQQFRSAYEQQKVVSQNLLFPITVELGPDHADTLEQTAEAIAGLGVVVEFFGDTTWVIKAVPAMLGKLSPQDVLTDILDGLASRSSSSLSYLSETVPECIDNLLASMACKAAIKAGNHLRPEEMLELLRQMGNSKVFSHCPHGRPVLKIFSRLEIEKWFRRS